MGEPLEHSINREWDDEDGNATIEGQELSTDPTSRSDEANMEVVPGI